MLPKINRLKSAKKIDAVFREGRGFKGSFLFIKLTKNHLNVSRFAFLVGRKVAQKATQRNQMKRRLRDIIKKEMPCIKKGVDLVVIPQKSIENKNFQAIKKETKYLLKKAGLFI